MMYQFINRTSLKPSTRNTIYTWFDGIMIILWGNGTQAEYNTAPFFLCVWHKAVGSSHFYELLWNKQVDAYVRTYVSTSENY